MHDEWLRVASDGFVARLPGGAHAQEHRLRPLPVRPRRDDGNELVEHGARSSFSLLLFRGGGSILLRIERERRGVHSSIGWRWIFKIGSENTNEQNLSLGKKKRFQKGFCLSREAPIIYLFMCKRLR